MTPEERDALAPGTLLRAFGVEPPAVYLCPDGAEGAWVAFVNDKARDRATGAPDVSALCPDELSVYEPAP